MKGYVEDRDGNLYEIRGKARTPLYGAPGAYIDFTLVLISPLHVDGDREVLAYAEKGFYERFRSVSPAEFECRIRATLKEQAEREKAESEPKLVQVPKDAEIARPLDDWDERDIQRGYKRGYDFRGTDNR